MLFVKRGDYSSKSPLFLFFSKRGQEILKNKTRIIRAGIGVFGAEKRKVGEKSGFWRRGEWLKVVD